MRQVFPTKNSSDLSFNQKDRIYSRCKALLIEIKGGGRNYQVILESKGHDDHIVVRVELNPGFFMGDIKSLENLRGRIVHELIDEILIAPEINLREPGGKRLPKERPLGLLAEENFELF